jgi:hypothetical protein
VALKVDLDKVALDIKSQIKEVGKEMKLDMDRVCDDMREVHGRIDCYINGEQRK